MTERFGHIHPTGLDARVTVVTKGGEKVRPISGRHLGLSTRQHAQPMHAYSFGVLFPCRVPVNCGHLSFEKRRAPCSMIDRWCGFSDFYTMYWTVLSRQSRDSDPFIDAERCAVQGLYLIRRRKSCERNERAWTRRKVSYTASVPSSMVSKTKEMSRFGVPPTGRVALTERDWRRSRKLRRQ